MGKLCKLLIKGGCHMFDEKVLQCFLDNQLQLYPEPVAETLEGAESFLEECMAVVVDSVKEVWEFFEEEGVDMEGADEEEILEADEVFEIGDGRYLIVEG
ncbi:MAG: glyoxalase [Lachnospiraceae bacterium]|nr:glyoxalase [Lachnospiraceae bacterium]